MPVGACLFSNGTLRWYGPYCPRPGGPCRSQGSSCNTRCIYCLTSPALFGGACLLLVAELSRRRRSGRPSCMARLTSTDRCTQW